MSRLALLAAATLAGAAAQAQRVDIDPARSTSMTKPVPARPGDLIASDISDADDPIDPDGRAEYFWFNGRAGQAVTAQVASDIPTLEVMVREASFRSPEPLARGPAKDVALRVVLPKDGTYFLVVSAQGPRRQGKYLLSLGADGQAPALVAAPSPAGPVPPARFNVDPGRWTTSAPIHTRPGEIVAGEISAVDVLSGVDRYGDVMQIMGRAGETITAQLRSDNPSLQVAMRAIPPGLRLSPLVEGPARDAPIRLVLPKDGTYEITVQGQGQGGQAFGKYLLAIGTDQGLPPFDPPKPKPDQGAGAPTAVKPAPAPAPEPKPAAPPTLPKLTPPPGVMAAEIGESISRPAGKPGTSVDVYAFIGEAGAVLQAEAVGAGRYGITLYTPEGDEMLTATGAGAAKLTAVLPKDAVYLLAVAREDRVKPYKLSLGAESPDVFQWSQREGAGYERLGADGKVTAWTCWVTPGSVLRYHLASGRIQTQTLRAGGAGRWDYVHDGKPASYGFTTRINGTTFTRITEMKTQNSWSLDDPRPTYGAYKGYLCD